MITVSLKVGGEMTIFLLIISLMTGSLLSISIELRILISLILLGLFIYDYFKNKELNIGLIFLISSLFIFYISLKNIPIVFNSLTKFSLFFSGIVGKLISKPISLAMNYSGLDLIILFFISSLIYYLVSNNRKYINFIIGLIPIWAIYIIFWSVLAENNIILKLNTLEPFTGPLDYRIFLFFILIIWFNNINKREEISDIDKKILYIPGILIILSVIIIIPKGKFSEKEINKIIFWDSGLNFDMPNNNNFGLDNVGMFGYMPKYLENKGYSCEIKKEIVDLKENDILIIINPNSTPSDKELKNIWSFVENGGTVIGLGDHTGNEEIRKPLNRILEPAGIRLNFDSAISFKKMWSEGFDLRNSIIFKEIDSRNIQIVVGASLDIDINVKPLIVGKGGYSDLGNLENIEDGYLGDMKFNRGERIGDLVLAAESNYGKGKFIVFGDTTHFQNTVIPFSDKFLDNLFSYIGKGNENKNMDIAIIDDSNFEIISRDKSNDGIDGLLANLLRNDYMPVINEKDNLIDLIDERIKLIFLFEPIKDIKNKEKLEDFMKNGGKIIFCGDYTSPNKSFIESFGYNFDNVPLGRVSPLKNEEMSFWNACPILFENKDTEIIMDVWNYPVIVKKTMENGGLYIIGDKDFLKNKNLENIDSYSMGNINFLKTIIEKR